MSKNPPDRFLHLGDVLVCNIARGTLGRVCHVDSVEDKWTADTQVMIVRPGQRCLGKWLFYYLYSRRGQRELLTREKGIAFADKRGQTHLYPRDVLTIPVPVPVIADQQRMVAYLNDARDRTEELKHTQDNTATELARLEESVVTLALSGQI